MKRYDFYTGLFLMALSAGICTMAFRLGLGNIHNPGPGLIPLIVAALLGLMSIGLSIKGLIEAIKGYQEKEVFKGIAWEKPVMALCGLLGYGIFFNYLGFRISTFLLMILLLGAVSRVKWRGTLAISLITVICAYLIFVVWLGCPFPKGPFGI